MRIALGQLDCTPGDVHANTRVLVNMIEEASANACDLVLFPEMSDVGYEMPKIVEAATSWSEGSYKTLAAAAEKYRINVIAGLAERDGDAIYNGIAVIGRKGEALCKYRKIHLVTAEPMLEHHFLSAGSELAVCDIEGLKFGFMTCYDIRFPELARGLMAKGVDVLAAPSAFPLLRMEHWRTITSCRAIENQAYVVAPNRIGSEGGVVFGGVSRVIDPYGVCIASMSEIDRGLLMASISKARVAEVRDKMKALQDRRLDLYGGW